MCRKEILKEYFQDRRDFGFIPQKKEIKRDRNLTQFSFKLIKGTSKTCKDHIINLLKIEGYLISQSFRSSEKKSQFKIS